MKRWKSNNYAIEKFIAKNNGYIQFFFLMATLMLGVIVNISGWQEQETIIIEMLGLLSVELIILNINRNIPQVILKWLNVRNDKNHTVVVTDLEEGYNKFPSLLSQVEGDLFISGITCNGIWNYTSTIEEILKRENKIKILISSDQALESNVRIYYGLNSKKEIEQYIDNVQSKTRITLDNLKTNEIIKENYNKYFEIRRTDIPFTIACVGINIWSSNSQKQQLKVTTYVSNRQTEQCPNVFLNSVEHKNLYNFYVKILKELWENAEPVSI